MKYLVTGGCGFIGSHLCDALLANGHQVVVLDNLSTGRIENLDSRAELVAGTVEDSVLVEQLMSDVDGCFHLAAIASVQQSQEDWGGSHRTNQSATVNILQSARATADRKAVPVVYASSAAVYGDNASTPLQEKDATCPISAYGADKLGCELHARIASLQFQVPTMGLRFFNVYGPRQNPDSPYSGVISIFADRIRQQQSLMLLGDGEQSRDFVHVSDIVAMLGRAMERASQQQGNWVLNACTGEATTLLQLIRTLAAITGTTPEIIRKPPRSGDIRISLGCPQRLHQVLGMRARMPLGQGLKDTLEAL